MFYFKVDNFIFEIAHVVQQAEQGLKKEKSFINFPIWVRVPSCAQMKTQIVKDICIKCGNETIIQETIEPESSTLMCLHCGYYQTEIVSFYMHLPDVNQMREYFGLEPVTKLIPVNRNL